GEPEVDANRLLNDLGAIPAVADLVHPRAATRPPRMPQARSAVTRPLGAARQAGVALAAPCLFADLRLSRVPKSQGGQIAPMSAFMTRPPRIRRHVGVDNGAAIRVV